jgi:Domain of unknown function (DUF4412)
MRNVWSMASIVVLGLSVAGVQPAAAQGFDGTLTYQIHTESGKTMTMVTMSKGNKLRLEMSDPENPMRSGAFVIDNDAHTRMMIMNGQKKYIVMPESMTNMMGKGATAANTPTFTFTKTGRTETVAGVSCDVIHGTGTNNGKAEEADICVAKGVGFNPGMFSSMAGQNPAPGLAALHDAIGAGNGVLKFSSTKEGKPDATMEVTKIDRSSPSSDEFNPPAGYTAVQIPAGMGAGAAGGKP